MLSSEHDGIIVIGKRKKGKSTLTKHLYRNEKRVMLYDAKHELKEPLQLVAGESDARLWEDKGIVRACVVQDGKHEPWDELEWSAYLAMLMGHCVYVVDELPDALEDKDPGQYWKWVVRMGRKRDIRFLFTFQRPAEVPVMARAQSSDWYIFQTNEASDLDYLRRSIGKEGAETVSELPVGNCLHVRDGKIQGIVETEKPDA